MIIKVLTLVGFLSFSAFAQSTAMNIDLSSFTSPLQFSSSISLLLAISSISLAPFFLISTTSFVRFAIVLGMIRNAIGTNQSPPNPVIISIALFMTFYVMTPTWVNVYENAIIPYQNNEITQRVAFQKGIEPFRTFMLRYTRQQDLALFIEFSKVLLKLKLLLGLKDKSHLLPSIPPSLLSNQYEVKNFGKRPPINIIDDFVVVYGQQ